MHSLRRWHITFSPSLEVIQKILLANIPTTSYNNLVWYLKAFTYIIEEGRITKDTLTIICFCQLIVNEFFSIFEFFWHNQKVLHKFLESFARLIVLHFLRHEFLGEHLKLILHNIHDWRGFTYIILHNN